MNSFSKIIVLMLVSMGLTSCLKDDNIDDQKYGMINLNANKIVDFNTGRVTAALSISATPTEYNVPLYYRAETPLASDMAVTLSVDQATLTKYNASAGTAYELLPAAAYTMSTTVTIPAGKTEVNIPIKLNTTLIDPAKSYAIPVKIVSANGATVSGNFGSVIVAVAVKNIYDGKYAVTGSVVREGDPVLSGNFPLQEYSLLTVDATTVIMNRVAVWANGTNIGGIGPFKIKINPTTNAVTVSDDVNPAVVNNSAGVNSYDPATKTIRISVFWGTGPANRAWVATFVKK